MEQYYSQFGQDKFIIENIFKKMTDGFFVDIGAGDGVHISNTYALEKQYNWTGVCVECNSISYDNLIKNRSCKFYNKPITEKGGVVEFNQIDNFGYHTTLFSSIYEVPVEFKSNAKKIKLQSATIDDFLDEINAPNMIHYLSLDIEGGEYEILESFFANHNLKNNWTREIISLSVEHNFDEIKRNKIKNLLESNLYTRAACLDVDDIYIHKLFEINI